MERLRNKQSKGCRIQWGKINQSFGKILFLVFRRWGGSPHVNSVQSKPVPKSCRLVSALGIRTRHLQSRLGTLASSCSQPGLGRLSSPSGSVLSWNKSPPWITADVFIPRDTTLNIRMSKPSASAIRYCQRGNKKGV